jgi:uncharacterized protein YndB with AHSA1/START domain
LKLEARSYVQIPRSAHEVYEAIVDPAHMRHYFISSGTGRLEPGQVVTWTWDDVGAEIPVQVVEAEPDRHVVLAWAATGIDTVITVELTPLGENATAVEVVERGWDPDPDGIASYGEQTGGWVDMLLCLKVYLVYGINLRTGEVLDKRA